MASAALFAALAVSMLCAGMAAPVSAPHSTFRGPCHSSVAGAGWLAPVHFGWG